MRRISDGISDMRRIFAEINGSTDSPVTKRRRCDTIFFGGGRNDQQNNIRKIYA